MKVLILKPDVDMEDYKKSHSGDGDSTYITEIEELTRNVAADIFKLNRLIASDKLSNKKKLNIDKIIKENDFLLTLIQEKFNIDKDFSQVIERFGGFRYVSKIIDNYKFDNDISSINLYLRSLLGHEIEEDFGISENCITKTIKEE